MNKVLVLEDNKQRIDFFNKIFKNYDYTICETAKEAMEVLDREEFNVIFLDHDLGGLTFVDSSQEESGATVVRHIIARGSQKDAFFMIHSQNPVGAAYMLNLLVEYGRRAVLKSFTSIYNENKVGF